MAPPNIVLFGETGAGKSSVVNLLAGANVASTSSGSIGCTFKSTAYNVSVDGTMFKLHDTAGLDEGQGGGIVKQHAILQLYELLRKLNEGVNLLIFCMRGPRIKESVFRNWQLFWDIICQRRVPILLAITGLENEEDMDAWWGRNQEHFKRYQIYPSSVACITATRGRRRPDGSFNFDREYAESLEKLRKAIFAIYRIDAWKVGRVEWLKKIVETSYASGKEGVEEIKTSRTVLGSATNELINRGLMDREEAEELAWLLRDI